MARCYMKYFFFFFNDTATTEIYTLSLHDALPISQGPHGDVESIRPVRTGDAVAHPQRRCPGPLEGVHVRSADEDRKSTRLNSSHVRISYAVFCLKKKK